MYLFQMAANVGDGVKALRYASLFTLFAQVFLLMSFGLLAV